MEEDGRFNAGRGSTLRLDGKTVVFFAQHVPIGLIAVARSGYGVACNRQMAWSALIEKDNSKS